MMPVEALMLAMAERGWSSEQEAAAILDKLEKWGFSLVADIELERVWLARDADTRPSWLRRLLGRVG